MVLISKKYTWLLNNMKHFFRFYQRNKSTYLVGFIVRKRIKVYLI